jgi:hypothetical protein
MAAQARYQLQFMGGWVFEGGVLLFPNPPFVALILSPLSILPLNAAFYLWSFIQLGLIIWLIFGFNRHFIDWSKQERLLMVTAILAFWPLAKTLLLGQFSIILLIGLFQTFIAMKNLKLTQSGLWLVLLAIKPHTLFIPAMMTLNKRNWRMAASALIVGIFLFIFTSLFLGIKPWIQYIQNLLTMSTFYGKLGVNPSGEYTLRGVLSNLLGNSQGNLTNLISSSILLCGMIYVGFLWWKDVSAGSSKFSLYFAFTILLTVILSLHLNPHDALVLVLPAVLFYDYLRQNNYPRKVISILFLLCPTIFFIDAFHSINLLGFIRLPIVVMMIVLCWMVKYLVLEYRITRRTKLPGNAPLS